MDLWESRYLISVLLCVNAYFTHISSGGSVFKVMDHRVESDVGTTSYRIPTPHPTSSFPSAVKIFFEERWLPSARRNWRLHLCLGQYIVINIFTKTVRLLLHLLRSDILLYVFVHRVSCHRCSEDLQRHQFCCRLCRVSIALLLS